MAKRGPVLTRAQAAHRLGLKRTAIARYDGRELFPTRNVRGHREYKVQEVEAFRIRRGTANKRERAAFIFDLFTEGKELTDIVYLTRLHPHEVRDLYAEWMTPLEPGRAKQKERELAQRRTQLQRERKAELETIETEERQLAEKLERISTGKPA